MRYLLIFTLFLAFPLIAEEENSPSYSIEEEGEEGCALQGRNPNGPQEMRLPRGYSSRRCHRRPCCGDVNEAWYDDDEASWPTRKEEDWVDDILRGKN